MSKDEAEQEFRKELSEGTINTADTPHYDSLEEYCDMLRNMGVIIEDE